MQILAYNNVYVVYTVLSPSHSLLVQLLSELSYVHVHTILQVMLKLCKVEEKIKWTLKIVLYETCMLYILNVIISS